MNGASEPSGDDWHQFSVRLPAAMHLALKTRAMANGRCVNAELRAIMRKEFGQDKLHKVESK